MSGGFLALFVAAVCVAAYFLPSWVAFGRGHPNRWAVLLLNLFLGWTLVGWVVALVWSATAFRARAV